MKSSVHDKYTPEVFDPRDPYYRWHLWVQLEDVGQSSSYYIYWRRIAVVALLTVILTWLAGAAAVAGFLRYRHGFTGISYTNLVWPPNWPEHRRSLGRHYLARARELVASQRPLEAIPAYQAGLARVPEDNVGRRELAMLLLNFGNIPAALKILEPGLSSATDDVEYLNLACALMFELQEDARVATICKRALPATPTERLADQLLALNLARVHFRAGNYDAAERILVDWRLERSVEGLLLRAGCDWERGYQALALQRIQLGRDNFPGRSEIPLQLVSYYMELGRPRDAITEAIVRITADPDGVGPRVDLLHCLHAVDEQARYTLEVERFFHDFPTNVRAMELLADTAATFPDIALVERAIQAIKATQGDTAPARLSLVIAQIEADHYDVALRAADVLHAEIPPSTSLSIRLGGWRAVAARGAGELTTANLLLDTYVASMRLAGPEALVVARRLERSGAGDLARKVYVGVLRVAPKHQAALTQLVRLDAASNNGAGLELYLPQLLETKKPSAAALQEAYMQLDDNSPTRTALRRQIEAFLKASPSR